MTATDDRPSIAELQRITRTTCPRCGGPAGACCAPRTMEEQAEDDAALRAATPVLLEIIAAALACQEQDRVLHRAGCEVVTTPLDAPEWARFQAENVKLRACSEAFAAALAKVRQ